jgi:YfiH family protein
MAMEALDARWTVPDWPAPARVRAICSTRAGGVSQAPYDSLNLGDHVGDAPQAVAANRQLFGAALQARPVFLSQVHGCDAVQLAADTPDATPADGCFTTASGVACTIMVADCLPVLFTTASGSAVAAAHAGWRGLAGDGARGILETVCEQLLRESRSTPAEVLAWLGPCIGPRMFEVGAEVKAAFEANDRQAAQLFRPRDDGKWLADLQGLARRRLGALGVTQIYGNDGADGWCTVTNPSRFFSYRRDRVCGRFAAAVWLA